MEAVDEDAEYSGKQIDKDVVNLSTILAIIREEETRLPEMFPDRIDNSGNFEVSKMLLLKEFNEGDSFLKKIIFQSKEDHKTNPAQFRSRYVSRN